MGLHHRDRAPAEDSKQSLSSPQLTRRTVLRKTADSDGQTNGDSVHLPAATNGHSNVDGDDDHDDQAEYDDDHDDSDTHAMLGGKQPTSSVSKGNVSSRHGSRLGLGHRSGDDGTTDNVSISATSSPKCNGSSDHLHQIQQQQQQKEHALIPKGAWGPIQPAIGRQLATKRSLLCDFEDLPAWMQDNVGIRTGYRIPDNYSYWACFESLFYLHNESGNIWTHLLGAIVFIFLAFYINENVFPAFPTLTWGDKAATFAFILGAIVCLACSAIFHSVIPHSEHVSINFNKLDYVGIILLIVGSFCPAVFYSFFCEPWLQAMYISMISSFGLLLVYMSVSSYFRQPHFRSARTLLFLAMGLSGIFPIIHSIAIHGYELAENAGSLNHMYTMGALYVFGAFLYGVRVPEMACPGSFDFFFHSHQIFHVCVVAAAWVHYLGTLEAMSWWHSGEGAHICHASH